MKIALIDVDGHNFPNLPLMKLAAWHKHRGDHVEWYSPLFSQKVNTVYMSKVFTFTSDYMEVINADCVVKHGTGYGDYVNNLPPEIEHIMPDYSLYGIQNTAYGFLTRGCPRGCPFCIVAKKEGRKSRKVANLKEFWNGQKEIVLLDPNLLACDQREDLLCQLAESNAFVNFSQGIDARLLDLDTVNLLSKIKIKRIHFAWDNVSDEKKIFPKLQLYQQKTGANRHNTTVYILTNFGSTIEQDLYRINKIREMNLRPYVMVYDKVNADKTHKDLQRWCNNGYIFYSEENFYKYKKHNKEEK